MTHEGYNAWDQAAIEWLLACVSHINRRLEADIQHTQAGSRLLRTTRLEGIGQRHKMNIKQLAREYLSQRWEQQAEQFPMLRRRIPKDKYVSANLPYLIRGDYWPARLKEINGLELTASEKNTLAAYRENN